MSSIQVIRIAKALQQEGQETRNLLTQFAFLPNDIPTSITDAIDALKLQTNHCPIELNVCGMYVLNYFVFYAVRDDDKLRCLISLIKTMKHCR